jgi:exopolyphosphatase / guanosine-5'-triphosphate,3'-diphosphate pyrophosphatase
VLRAAIDVGSNSVLLLVEKYENGRWSRVLEETDVTSLGAHLKVTGALSEEGMTRTLAALARFFVLAKSEGVAEIRAAVTMSARIAKNSDEFLSRAESQGTPIFVLSGDDEAELGFQAIADDPLFNATDRLSIIDVGGHSTEITTADRVGSAWDIRFRQSYAIGTLALIGGTLREECPDISARLHACKEIDDIFGLAYLPGQSGLVVALGATGTNLVSIREKLLEWDPEQVNGKVVSYEEVSKAAAWLSDLTIAERSMVPGIEKGREATLPAGALILERALFALRAEECAVSTRGWRHALLERGLPTKSPGHV